MQSNQLVNFANEFDFMPDLALITISKVLRARSVRGCQGEGPPKTIVCITHSKWGIDLFLGFDQISKCSLVDGAGRVGGPVESPRSRGAAGPERGRFPPFTGRCHTCPEFQACTLQGGRLESGRKWRVEGEEAPREPEGREGSPEQIRRALAGPPGLTPAAGPVLFQWLQKLEEMRPDNDASVHAARLVITLARFYLRFKSWSSYRSSFEVVRASSEPRIFRLHV